MRNNMYLTHVFLAGMVVSIAACAGFQTSDIAPRSLGINGTYDWVDSFGNDTACRVHIFWQDEAWRGWIRTDNENAEVCPWDGYEIPEMRMRGDRVRMSIACPRSGCPTSARRGTSYLLDVVPGVMLTGESQRGGTTARWHSLRLVRRG